jgi:hypothetical protein
MTWLVGHHQVVQLDEHRGALDRVELDLRRLVQLVVLGVAPAHQVAAGPLVGLLRNLPVVNCSMKICGSGCVMVVVYISMSAQNFW